MTLTIFFAALVLVGIALLIWGALDFYSDWQSLIGAALVATFAIGLMLNLFIWTIETKQSEITYRQLVQEKQTIEKMLDADKDVDRILLNKQVIEYNNQIIQIQINTNRTIYKDYYSKKVDWDALEMIEWD